MTVTEYEKHGGIIKTHKIIKKFIKDLLKDEKIMDKLNKSKINIDRIKMLNISFLNYLLGGPSGFAGLNFKDIYDDCEFLNKDDYESLKKYFLNALMYFGMKNKIEFIKKKINLIK